MSPSRSDTLTVVAVAITAYALCDLGHEIAHGFVALIVPGVRILSISTVALQNTGNSRAVAAAGSIANIVVGIVALALFRHRARFCATGFFLWLFGSINLMNGLGYPLYSAILAFGDWEVVIRGLEPGWMYRAALGIAGAAGYIAAIRLSARELSRAVQKKFVARAEIVRLVFASYVAGGLLLVVAALFNPISSRLVLLSGFSSGFAAMAGLTLVPRLVERQTAADGTGTGTGTVVVLRNPMWMVTGLVVGALFVFVAGPGIQF